jgi:SAM-dependent methyltransferase
LAASHDNSFEFEPGRYVSRRVRQIADVFAMRAHAGWAHYLLQRTAAAAPPVAPVVERINRLFESYTDSRTERFDRTYGTDTFKRRDVKVRDGFSIDELRWGYSAINPEFFREIMRSIGEPLDAYSFVDVGSGKGAAVMLASEFPFRRVAGVELTPELVEIAASNVERYVRATGKHFAPDWIQGDFFAWDIPNEPQLFFLNNPFPKSITTNAIEHIEASIRKHPRPVLLAFRKAPQNTGDYLHASTFWRPVRLAPYWRVYAHSQQ